MRGPVSLCSDGSLRRGPQEGKQPRIPQLRGSLDSQPSERAPRQLGHEGRQRPLIPSLREANECLGTSIVVRVHETCRQRIANRRRIGLDLGTNAKRGPVADVLIGVRRQLDESGDRPRVFIGKGPRDREAHLGARVRPQLDEAVDAPGIAQVAEGKGDRFDDRPGGLSLQHAHQELEAIVREGPLRDAELSEDVRA